uniref:Uncharacterized protein n=1 Tax=Hyaloperonospora arabidopsidis (strain Emoy2) TaxID=559515 RepID=M4BHH4_HYAAE
MRAAQATDLQTTHPKRYGTPGTIHQKRPSTRHPDELGVPLARGSRHARCQALISTTTTSAMRPGTFNQSGQYRHPTTRVPMREIFPNCTIIYD